MKPRMREMYGIWSCITPGCWGAGWTAEDAYKNWKEKLTILIWERQKSYQSKKTLTKTRFG